MPARTQKRVYTEGVYQTQPIVFRPIMKMFTCILVMQFYFDGSFMLMIAGGVDAIIANHFELRARDVTDKFDHEVIDVFLNRDYFSGFMILIPVLDGFGVIVIGSDTALSHGWFTGIADHVFDDLIFAVLLHFLRRSVDIETIGEFFVQDVDQVL